MFHFDSVSVTIPIYLVIPNIYPPVWRWLWRHIRDAAKRYSGPYATPKAPPALQKPRAVCRRDVQDVIGASKRKRESQMKNRLSLGSLEQMMWWSTIMYFGMVSEDYGLDVPPYDRFTANLWLLGMSGAAVGILRVIRWRRERKVAAAG